MAELFYVRTFGRSLDNFLILKTLGDKLLKMQKLSRDRQKLTLVLGHFRI